MAALVPAVVGVGGLVTLWQVFLRWRAGHADEAWEVAGFMLNMFGDVIAYGEVDSAQFMTEEARSSETRLKDLIDQVRDKTLRTRLDELLKRWKETFGHAPPPVHAFSVGPGDTGTAPWDTPERHEQAGRQVEAAREGKTAAKAVKTRCNELRHFMVPSQ